jgi:hypothetical protein
MDPDSAEMIEVSEGESAWALWVNGHEADTGGLCKCGHEGLGPGWHEGDCPGSYEALWRKVRELFIQIYDVPPWTAVELEEIQRRAKAQAAEYQKFVD